MTTPVINELFEGITRFSVAVRTRWVAAALALLASASPAQAQPCAPEGASSPCLGGLGIRYCVNGAWAECRIETCDSFRGITLSDGPTATAEDLAQFDARWTNDHAGE